MAKAILLAAGRGSRLGATTAEQPKCLVALEGHPLVHWQVAALRSAGIQDIALVTGYRRESLAPICQHFGLHEFHNPDWSTTTQVSSLGCASTWLETGECLVSYSDIVYHPDLVRSLLRSDAPISLTCDERWHDLWSLRFENPLEDAENFRMDSSHRLLAIGGRASRIEDIQAQYMGLLKFRPEGWQAFWEKACAVKDGRPDMTGLLAQLLHLQIEAVPISGGWCEVDCNQDLEQYQAALAGGAFSHDWRGDWVGSQLVAP